MIKTFYRPWRNNFSDNFLNQWTVETIIAVQVIEEKPTRDQFYKNSVQLIFDGIVDDVKQSIEMKFDPNGTRKLQN